MRQVPKYLIIGNGRLARHLRHYFDLLKIKQYSQWDRSQPLARLHEQITDANRILIAISDDAIEPFIDEHLMDIAPCAHIKMFNTAYAALRAETTAATVDGLAAAIRSFERAHSVSVAGRRQIGQIDRTLDNLRGHAAAGDAARAAAAVRKVGENLKSIKASLPSATRIHFSGSLVTKKAWGAHPLMTFGPEMYPLEKYLAIPFVVDQKAPSFRELFPGLHNRHVRLPERQKAKYHALCVMSGNFSCLLWQKLFQSLQEEFNIPPQTAEMYLRQQMDNLLADYRTALTGPLKRGDKATIDRNIRALEGDPFRKIYEAFVEAYPQIEQHKTRERKAS